MFWRSPQRKGRCKDLGPRVLLSRKLFSWWVTRLLPAIQTPLNTDSYSTFLMHSALFCFLLIDISTVLCLTVFLGNDSIKLLKMKCPLCCPDWLRLHLSLRDAYLGRPLEMLKRVFSFPILSESFVPKSGSSASNRLLVLLQRVPSFLWNAGPMYVKRQSSVLDERFLIVHSVTSLLPPDVSWGDAGSEGSSSSVRPMVRAPRWLSLANKKAAFAGQAGWGRCALILASFCWG